MVALVLDQVQSAGDPSEMQYKLLRAQNATKYPLPRCARPTMSWPWNRFHHDNRHCSDLSHALSTLQTARSTSVQPGSIRVFLPPHRLSLKTNVMDINRSCQGGIFALSNHYFLTPWSTSMRGLPVVSFKYRTWMRICSRWGCDVRRCCLSNIRPSIH